MVHSDAIAIARLGQPVRRDAWAVTKTIYFAAGPGSTPAVCVVNNAGVITVLKNSDLTPADRSATDWRAA